MDERITTPLPVWVVTQYGDVVNLAQVDRMYLKAQDPTAADALAPCCVMAMLATGRVVMAECESEAMAEAALKKLTHLLPIALVDMTLDIIAPLEREQATAAQNEAAQ